MFCTTKHDGKVKRGNWLKKILALRSEIESILSRWRVRVETCGRSEFKEDLKKIGLVEII